MFTLWSSVWNRAGTDVPSTDTSSRWEGYLQSAANGIHRNGEHVEISVGQPARKELGDELMTVRAQVLLISLHTNASLYASRLISWLICRYRMTIDRTTVKVRCVTAFTKTHSFAITCGSSLSSASKLCYVDVRLIQP